MTKKVKISLRKSIKTDLEVFFLNQTDKEANFMAAFTSKAPLDKLAYMTKWLDLMANDAINMQTILVEEEVVGHVVKFIMEEAAEITYAINKAFWGRGITTKAVKEFLKIERTRPIYGRVAFDNYGSQKVLEKARFKKVGRNKSYANARGKEVEEYIYKLNE